MPDLMKLTLRDHVSILSGFPFASENFSDREGKPLIRIRDLLSDTLGTFYLGPYPSDFLIGDGDVLVGMDGDFNIIRWSKGPALLNQRVCKIESSSKELDQGFLYWLLEPELLRIHRRTPQTTVRHLSTSDLYALEVMVPPVIEQEKIAQILNTLDTQIRQTEALIAKLERIKQGLLTDLLTRGIDENGQLRPTPDEAPRLYKDSPLGLIPLSWEVCSVIELCVLGRGRVISQEYLANNPGPYPVYSSQTKDDGVFGRIDTYDFEGPHVTWTTDGANAGTVTFRDGMFNCTNVCGTMRSRDDGVHMPFLALALGRYTSRYVSRVGNDKLMNNVMASIQIQIPSLHEQQVACEKYDLIDQRLSVERVELAKLACEKSALMDDLLTGRVRVSPLLNSSEQAAI